ncbi:isoquinoline 1-oxidoreductase [Janthinobacterium sp. BJB412]|nr:isoquinoline 1-oxidoreductase [Janthinobacterium sp. BJB412]
MKPPATLAGRSAAPAGAGAGPDHPGRRRVLQSGALGGLMIALGGAPAALAAAASAAPAAAPAPLGAWLRVAADGAVSILSNTSEIGQGTGTALAQILANELDLDWRSVGLEMAPLDLAHQNPRWAEQATYGSGGVAGQLAPLRKAGAQARAVLIAAAAQQWRVAPQQCDTEAGFVLHPPTRRRLSYGSLAAAAARLPLPEQPALMPRERWRFIGRDVARLDLPAKTDGSAVYGVDVQLPGLLSASIRQAPRFGGRLASVDPAPALAVRGVRQVVAMADAVAVVAEHYWAASKGLAALRPVWDDSQATKASSADYAAALAAAVQAGGATFARKSQTVEQLEAEYAAALAGAVQHAEAVYTVPFLHHATMEPMNGTAHVVDGRAELWLPTQTQTSTRARVAKELGLAEERVTLHTTLAGGGFGRRIEHDFALQAARIAKAVGRPVKLIWSREEDMAHGFYRPAAAMRLRAGLDAQGMPLCLRFDTAGESLFKYSLGGTPATAPVDSSGVGALGKPWYRMAASLVAVSTVDIGVPVGYWRSVAASQNCFAYEGFIDELAARARLDPLDYRCRLLAGQPRHLRVLDAVAALSGWERPAGAGRFRGLALDQANGSIVAHVLELAVDRQSRVKLHKVSTVIDCGLAVNPRNIRAQLEGGIAFALSAAFHGEITLDGGAVRQSNFHDYPLIGLADMPPVEVAILDSGEPAGGVGEEAVGPLAPALVNALFAATGRRVRSLPLAREGYTLR